MNAPGPRVLAPPPLRMWLQTLVEQGGSDLHLVVGHPPVQRLHGDLVELPAPVLTSALLYELLPQLCPPEVACRLESEKDVDFSCLLSLGERAVRVRVNVFFAQREPGMCLRLIPETIPDFVWAGFPEPVADRLANLRDGLVLVTGATGSGKTTTLAMIVNRIHQAGGHRIITVEEPVEYLFPPAPHSLVTQREVGVDVPSFADGLKYGLRQDPDVILVGEIRDRPTAQMALSAAETGHLVFSTLHARDAKGALTRYADLFPQDVQREVRAVLALSLRAVLSQRLLPSSTPGAKRELALEILWNTAPISVAIRNGKVESIDNYLLIGRDEGMLSFDESVRLLWRAGRITREVAEHNVRELAVLNR